MYDLRTELSKNLNDMYFHLGFDDILISEHNGIGTISSQYPDMLIEIFQFLETRDINVYINEPGNPANKSICFYSDDYKEFIESSTQVNDGSFRSPSVLRNWYFQIKSQHVVVDFLKEKYNAPLGFDNEYWYNLDTRNHMQIFKGVFRTRGSEIAGDRRVEFEEVIRELDEHEVSGIIEPDPLLLKAEQDLYFWYNANDRTNFTNILFTLISKADKVNTEKLRASYPYEVQVMKDFQYVDGYWDEIEKKYHS